MQDVFGIAQETSCTMSEQVLHRAGDVLRDVKAILQDSGELERHEVQFPQSIELQNSAFKQTSPITISILFRIYNFP